VQVLTAYAYDTTSVEVFGAMMAHGDAFMVETMLAIDDGPMDDPSGFQARQILEAGRHAVRARLEHAARLLRTVPRSILFRRWMDDDT
jgi:hypothetical protein